MEIIERRRRLRQRVLEEVSKWARGLPFKASVILIGSYARGDFNLWSDIDILVISPSFKGSPIERLKVLDILPGSEVVPLTPEEFERLIKRGDPLAVEALDQGVVLRDDLKLSAKKRG
ncbi:MAG TPA: nucleotidyltransferase domain-containing protein [Candidatus Methanomethylia archaeon]|nr:nucleotidyltransferase domain-containing protein [Candidatus Methanomethylicia archaeon]